MSRFARPFLHQADLMVHVQGVMLQFNRTVGLAANGTRSSVPFVAFVSCDQPDALHGSAINVTTIANNSTIIANTTTNANATETTQSSDVFELAANLSAVALVFYSEMDEVKIVSRWSCCTSSTSDDV